MKKKINLKIWMIVNIMPALFLLLFYWINVKIKHNLTYALTYTLLQYIILVFMGVSLYFVKKNRDIVDEYTKKILGMVDTICFKLSYVIFGFLLLSCLLIGASPIFIGYEIAGALCLLSVVHSIIFCVLDSRGIQ
ncbi:hypothetical protein [Clostridium kluyveri]|uniref:DUF2178 domain-containing protein n=1 Tax=Clostridium kluyveri TaxID=1534 RepID=A0A1L5F330_CLOKL|nr:hypothetical protein [Clostridium kluyveri]APM37419.1 hypothetical protein BS101_00890 [Clostridium kluyveri]UZQ48526.1 hypothetical protein OP486_10930 [Clostridium kluyveri]